MHVPYESRVNLKKRKGNFILQFLPFGWLRNSEFIPKLSKMRNEVLKEADSLFTTTKNVLLKALKILQTTSRVMHSFKCLRTITITYETLRTSEL